MDDSLSTMLSETDEATLEMLATICIGLCLFFIAVGIIWYVLQAIGFYTLTRKRGRTNGWIAWIPFCQYYLLGDLVGNYIWGFGHANWILVISEIVICILSVVNTNLDSPSSLFAVALSVLSLIFYVYIETAYYKLFSIYSKHPLLFLILSILFPFLTPIFVFAIRNKNPNPLV